MKRSRQAAGGFVKRQRVDPVGVLLNRLTRLPIEILNQILRMAVMPPLAIRYDTKRYKRWNRRTADWVTVNKQWTGTERMRLDNWLFTRRYADNDGDYSGPGLYYDERGRPRQRSFRHRGFTFQLV